MLHADEDDRLLTQSILDEMQYAVPLVYFNHIADVKNYIDNTYLPTVILVNNHDHLHRGIETIKHLKADALLNHVPIVVLGEITTSEYVHQYYRAGASTYIIKPSTLEATKKKIRLLIEYWLDVAEV